MTTVSDTQKEIKIYRDFGLLVGALFPVFFGLLHPLIKGGDYPVWPWIICAALVIPAVVYPKILAAPYHYWLKFGHVLGTINTFIIMGLVYFVMFMPISIYFKLIGRDILRINIGKNDSAAKATKTYKVFPDKSEVFSALSFRRPF